MEPGRFDEIKDFYGITDDFKENQLYVRKEGGKALYYVTQTVKDNFLDRLDWASRIQVIKTGLKVFELNTNALENQYRICQEGAAYVIPHIRKRCVQIGAEDFAKMLEGGQLGFDKFSPAFREAVAPLEGGAFVVTLDHEIAKKDPSLFLIAWRSRGQSINLLVSKKELHSRRQQFQHYGLAKSTITEGVLSSSAANGNICEMEETPSTGGASIKDDKKQEEGN
mmetsp:Transcript_45169/g.78172  ORF Transcript_45169/g.78172 Transcript_45169/m.78172 type:complete len:224 (-) Transcript_45169:199-870(-)